MGFLANLFGQAPKSAEDYFNRGITYAKKGKYDQAISDFDKALGINPKDANVYCTRGFVRAERGEPDQAISDYTKAIEIDPERAMAYHVRASAYDAKGEYDRAISDLNKALEINPRLAEAYNNRAVVYCHMKENDKAWEDLHKAQSLGYQVDLKLLRLLRQSLGKERWITVKESSADGDANTPGPAERHIFIARFPGSNGLLSYTPISITYTLSEKIQNLY